MLCLPVALLLLLLPPQASASALDDCSSRRPGGGTDRDYRVLRFNPAWLQGGSASAGPTDEELTASAQLCCVHTHIALDGSLQAPVLVTYDRSSITLGGAASLSTTAQLAMDRVCGMSMGSSDCSGSAAPVRVLAYCS